MTSSLSISQRPSLPITKKGVCESRSNSITTGVQIIPQLWPISSPKVLLIMRPGISLALFQTLGGPMNFPVGTELRRSTSAGMDFASRR